MLENIFMCSDCDQIAMADADEIGCVACKHTMQVIGHQETADPNRAGKKRVK